MQAQMTELACFSNILLKKLSLNHFRLFNISATPDTLMVDWNYIHIILSVDNATLMSSNA